MDATSKEYLLEVNVDGTSGDETGRYNADFSNSITEIEPFLIDVFPNPTSEMLFLKGDKLKSVQIQNALGEEVYREKINMSDYFEIDFSQYTNGAYLVILENHKGQKLTERIVKK